MINNYLKKYGFNKILISLVILELTTFFSWKIPLIVSQKTGIIYNNYVSMTFPYTLIFLSLFTDYSTSYLENILGDIFVKKVIRNKC